MLLLLLQASCLTGATIHDDQGSGTDTGVGTDVDIDTGTDTDPDWVASDFSIGVQGDTPNCMARWDATHAASSHECPGCNYALDWQFDVTYSLSEESTSAGCQPDFTFNKDCKYKKYYLDTPEDPDTAVASLLNCEKDATYYFNSFNTVWAHTSNAGPADDLAIVVLGYASKEGRLVVNQTYHSLWDQVTGDLQFTSTKPGNLLEGKGNVKGGPDGPR